MKSFDLRKLDKNREEEDIFMLSIMKNHYDEMQMVMNEDVKLSPILDEKRKTFREMDLSRYMGRGKKMFHMDAQEYVEELRNNDRI